MRSVVQSAAAAAVFVVAAQAVADVWEPADNVPGFTNPNILLPFAPPQLHDLANVAGTADQDWYRVNVEPNRSYDVSIGNSNFDWVSGVNLQRFDGDGSALIQSASPLDHSSFRMTLRWVNTDPGGENMIKVTGAASFTGNSIYEIALRETTLFCPRYNNTNGQISVLIVQRAASERGAQCNGKAFFLNEDQTVVGTQDLVIGPNDINVYALPGVTGLANQKGGAQIAHTCGIGGLKAKLVALEPATGFSFDTICSPRDQ